MNIQINETVKILNQGGIVIFPTDTAFGIGCRIDNEKAVKKLFKIRRRPLNQATPVLVDSIDMAQNYLMPVPHEVIEKLTKKYWPGALTIVLPCLEEKVPELVRGGTKTLGVRIPGHPTALEIITKTGIPILGPSANFHGEKTPFKFSELNKDLIKRVDFIVDGESGGKIASTVIDCSVKPWKKLREGAVKIKYA